MPILLILLVVAACLPVVWHVAAVDDTLLPFAELLVPAPFLVATAVNWFVYHPGDKAIHAAGGSGRAYPGRAAHWVMTARRFGMFVLLPATFTTVPQAV